MQAPNILASHLRELTEDEERSRQRHSAAPALMPQSTEYFGQLLSELSDEIEHIRNATMSLMRHAQESSR